MTKRGFTLIELSVVVVVLALISAIVAPRLLAVRSGQEARSAKFTVRDLAREARLRAVQEGATVFLRVASGSRLEMVRAAPLEGGEETVLRAEDLPSSVELGGFRVGAQSTGEAEWEVRFYADGRSSGGGLEVGHDGSVDSIVIASDGAVALHSGALPVAEVESWPAGENETRL